MSCPQFADAEACKCPAKNIVKTELQKNSFVCTTKTPTIAEMRSRLSYKHYTRVNFSNPSEVRAAFRNDVRWPQNQILTVGFYRDDYYERGCPKTVEDVINSTIAPLVNLKFVWDAPVSTAIIRITFGPENSAWSAVGTDALDDYYNSSPTMCLGFGCEPQDHYTIVHEFCHALGMIHEHLREDSGIRYDCEGLYKTMSGYPNYWGCKDIYTQILRFAPKKEYAEEDNQYSDYDPYSIMHYALQENRCDGGVMSKGQNTQLSPCDIFMLKKSYPRAGEIAATGACTVGPPLERDEKSIVAIIEKNYQYALMVAAVVLIILILYNIALFFKEKDNK